MNRKILIEQILNDAKEGYLVEGISKHAPQSYVDRVKKNPSERNRREWSSDNSNTNGSISDVENTGYVLFAVQNILANLTSSFHDGAEVPSAEELASRIMTEIKERAESFNEAVPTPKDIFAALHRSLQQDVLRKIKNRENSSFNGEYKYIHEAQRRKIALLKVVRSPQFKAAIKNEYKKMKFKPKNIIRNIFGHRETISPSRLKNI
ncbi:MAG: hypothetical protein IJ341_12645 [Bacteroidales bacterium]|nr:hypothetical protein [Bacteroidales bacterium]